jgi:hypothetical protein
MSLGLSFFKNKLVHLDKAFCPKKTSQLWLQAKELKEGTSSALLFSGFNSYFFYFILWLFNDAF